MIKDQGSETQTNADTVVAVKFLAFVLRIYSFVFHLSLSAFLLGVAVIARQSHSSIVNLPLPMADEDVLRDITLVGILGIVFCLLALTRGLKFFFVIWTFVFFYMLLKSYFLGPFAVWGTTQAKGAAWLTFGALGAFFGAAWAMKYTQRKAFF